jgi:hypothetical protein
VAGKQLYRSAEYVGRMHSAGSASDHRKDEMMRHTPDARKLLRALDAELAASSQRLGGTVEWPNQDRAVLELIACQIDRKVDLSTRYEEAEDTKTRLKLSAELRLLEAALARSTPSRPCRRGVVCRLSGPRGRGGTGAVPSFSADALATAGLYAFIGARLEAAYAAPNPFRGYGGRVQSRPLPEQLRRFRLGQPVTVPAWQLDGHSAHAAGFGEVIPRDRAVRGAAYVVGPDDVVKRSMDDYS